MSEWVEYSLEDVAEITSSKRIFYADYVDYGIPFYRSKEIIELYNRSEISNSLYISEQKYLEIKEKYGVPVIGDILLTSVGTLGIPYLVNNSNEFYFKDGNLTWIRKINKNIVLPDFIYCLLNSPLGKNKLDEITIGSTQAALTIAGLKKIKISVPNLSEQLEIVNVIQSISKKIELLHRQNKTLESMAEMLFRQWFVEEVDDSWILSSIGEVFDIKGGATPSTKESLFWNGNINWTSPRDLSGAKSIYLLSTERQITELGLSKISSGLLPNNTLLMSSRAPVGYLAITDIELAINQGYIAILEHENFGCEYMYLWCKVNMDIIKNSANGSVFQEISKASFKKIPFLIPDDERVKSFNKQGKILFKKIKSNTKNIQTLEKLRDTLLPKLMSGEVRVNYTPEEIKQ